MLIKKSESSVEESPEVSEVLEVENMVVVQLKEHAFAKYLNSNKYK